MYNNPVNDRNNTHPIFYQPTNTMQIHSQTPFSNVCHGFDDDDDYGDDDEFPRRGERFPQWGYQETKDLIEIRAQLEWDNSTSKRRKNMWDMVVNRMRDKGYRRTCEQCKGKWKNLVNRYKSHNPDPDNASQFPFFEEMVAVFTARTNRTQRVTDHKKGKKRSKSAISRQDSSDDEFNDDDEEDIEADTIQTGNTSQDPKAKPAGSSKRQKHEKPDKNPMKEPLASINEMMKNFMREQETIDTKWRELSKRREQERDAFEEEWRDYMKKLEKERLAMHRAWRERDEQRRVQEQSRADKRDEILALVLRRMTRDDK